MRVERFGKEEQVTLFKGDGAALHLSELELKTLQNHLRHTVRSDVAGGELLWRMRIEICSADQKGSVQ